MTRWCCRCSRSAGPAWSAPPPTSPARVTKQLLDAHQRGDAAEALRLYRQLLPIYTGIFRTQGVILVKAGLALQGRPVGPVRLPMVEATEHELSHLRQDLADAGLVQP